MPEKFEKSQSSEEIPATEKAMTPEEKNRYEKDPLFRRGVDAKEIYEEVVRAFSIDSEADLGVVAEEIGEKIKKFEDTYKIELSWNVSNEIENAVNHAGKGGIGVTERDIIQRVAFSFRERAEALIAGIDLMLKPEEKEGRSIK